MRGGRSDGPRGQTLPDFAVGVAVFLVTTSAIFLFVPQLTLPYDEQGNSLVVQRAAADLSDDMLAGEAPSELNETCTVAFFDRTDAAGCRFEGGDSVTEQLGIAPTYSVNVTVRDVPGDAPNSTVCRGDDADSIGDCASGDANHTLAVGPSLPQRDASVAVARRGAFVGEDRVVIEVGVW
jgi:hypothetical protein